MRELYRLVSFRAGEQTDWGKVRALFLPQAVVVPGLAREGFDYRLRIVDEAGLLVGATLISGFILPTSVFMFSTNAFRISPCRFSSCFS